MVVVHSGNVVVVVLVILIAEISDDTNFYHFNFASIGHALPSSWLLEMADSNADRVQYSPLWSPPCTKYLLNCYLGRSGTSRL